MGIINIYWIFFILAGVSLFIDFVEFWVSIFYVFCGFLLEIFKICKRNFDQFVSISKCARCPQNTTHNNVGTHQPGEKTR